MEYLISALQELPPQAIREACVITKRRLEQGFLDQCISYREGQKKTPYELIVTYQTMIATMDTIILAANAMENEA